MNIDEKAICEECGVVDSVDNPVDLTEDPYDKEINNCSIDKWLCAPCYVDRQGEI